MRVKDISLETFKTALIMRDELTEKFLSYIRDEDNEDIERYLYFFDGNSATYRISVPDNSYLKVNEKSYDKYKAFHCIEQSIEHFGTLKEKSLVRAVKKKLDTESALCCLRMLYSAYYKQHIEPLINHMANVEESVINHDFNEIEGDVELFKYHIADWRYNPDNHQCYKPFSK